MNRKLPRAAALAALAASTLLSPPSAAEVGAIHPEVVARTAAVRAAKGPDAYAALRELWRTWDRADPAQVEAAIGAVADDRATPPEIRVYAQLLEAYARRRRGDLDGSVARVRALGFVGRFVTVGPFDNEHKGGFERAFEPEGELEQPIVPGRAYEGKERPVRWRAPPDAFGYGWFDFGELLRPREEICAYATTFVSAAPGTRAPRAVSLWIGTAGAFKLFWNGKKVLEDPAYRDLDIDRWAATVTLHPGQNRLTIKVCGDEDAPKLALRIGDERGAPDLGVVTTSDAAASAEPVKAAAARAPTRGVEGPIQRFERATGGAKPDAAALEAYARYLWITGGDAKAEHKARTLARRAAEASPTVPRLLLAGLLAEDRNQRREWVERAAGLAGPARGDVRILLAEAELARSSTNFRDAVPIYEEVLAIDPDNVLATLGRVELYVEAGLKRTALETLEAAIARQPSAIALLRVYASELRAVGRDTEADEVEARYAALRFDDTGYLAGLVELAVARRDAAGAERWLGRLLQTDPDSAWARGVAARTYRALGQGDRALAMYQHALLLAPEDTASLRALADLYGEDGRREEELALLHKILGMTPQAKEVREYVRYLEPRAARADEAYAWAPERFLPMRKAADTRYPRRTLRDLTVTTVFPNGLASKFRQVVFQPLTDEAAAAGREFAFAYEADRQTVELRAAKVYREGSRVDEAIESGEGPANDPAIAMYTSQRTFYVHFPRLEPGDVVELRYRVDDVAIRNEIADYFGDVEYLQSDEPIGQREHVLVTPKDRGYHVYASKLPGLTTQVEERGDSRVQRFVATDVAPLAPEPSMPPWSEVLGYVHVSTLPSWDAVGKLYWGLAREQLDIDDELRKRLRELTKGMTGDREKVAAVYRYATELRYVALELGIEGIRPRRAAQTLARGWGDCKDKAALIVTMLRELGIPATMVLVRTGMRGDFGEAPASLAPFDHAIAYVPSLDLYLDGTAEHTGTNELPAMDRGALALQINEGNPKLVRLPQPPAEQSLASRKVDVALAADGSAQVGVDLAVTGVFAPDWRRRYLAEGTRRDRAARDFASDLGPLELAAGKAGVEVNDLDDEEQAVKVRVRGKAATFARREGDGLSLPAGPALKLVPDFAPLSARALDMVLTARSSRDDEWSIKLPPGLRVVAAPTPQRIETPFGRASVEVDSAPGKVVVRTRLALDRVRVPPAEYAAFRAFCEAADRAFGQRIVLGK
jgi:tetratricopeptide (TPR) repeat protein